jgi:hypothetical protein
VNNNHLIVPKTLKHVTLWVHPEGRVLGYVYLRKHSATHAGEELVLEALNRPEPFIVFKRESPPELRFYNRKAIIRVEYTGLDKQKTRAIRPLPCLLQMMDGALIDGTIEEPLHPNRARLLDYLNNPDETFIKLHMEGNTTLVNKAYIIHAHVDTLEDIDEDS